MREPNPFAAGKDGKSLLGPKLLSWHKKLEPDRGARAALRRAASPEDVALLEPFVSFLREVEAALGAKLSPDGRERLAAIAGLASHVEHHVPGKIARQMAGDPKAPKVSQLRFRRLLERERPAELYGTLLRVARMLDRRLNLLDLACSVYGWGPEVPRRWAYAYYGAPPRDNENDREGDPHE